MSLAELANLEAEVNVAQSRLEGEFGALNERVAQTRSSIESGATSAEQTVGTDFDQLDQDLDGVRTEVVGRVGELRSKLAALPDSDETTQHKVELDMVESDVTSDVAQGRETAAGSRGSSRDGVVGAKERLLRDADTIAADVKAAADSAKKTYADLGERVRAEMARHSSWMTSDAAKIAAAGAAVRATFSRTVDPALQQAAEAEAKIRETAQKDTEKVTEQLDALRTKVANAGHSAEWYIGKARDMVADLEKQIDTLISQGSEAIDTAINATMPMVLAVQSQVQSAVEASKKTIDAAEGQVTNFRDSVLGGFSKAQIEITGLEEKFTGMLDSLKSLLDKALGMLDKVPADMVPTPMVATIQSTIKNVISQMSPQIDAASEQAISQLDTLSQQVGGQISTLAEQATTQIGQFQTQLMEQLDKVLVPLTSTVAQASAKVDTAVESALTQVQTVKEQTISKIETMREQMAERTQSVVDSVTGQLQTLRETVDTELSKIQEQIDEATQTATASSAAVKESIDASIQSASETANTGFDELDAQMAALTVAVTESSKTSHDKLAAEFESSIAGTDATIADLNARLDALDDQVKEQLSDRDSGAAELDASLAQPIRDRYAARLDLVDASIS